MSQRPPKQFATERLVLRSCAAEDAESLFNHYTSDPDATKFLQREPHKSVSQTMDFINRWGEEFWENENNTQYAWSIFSKGSPEAIGIFLLVIHPQQEAEIHFGLSRKDWAKGYINEAATPILSWIKNDSSINKVMSYCDHEHKRAQKVLEKMRFRKVQNQGKKLRLYGFNCERYAYIYEWKRVDTN